MTQIAIFASGQGSNADTICRYFKHHPTIKVSCILSDRKAAGVFNVAALHKVPSVYLSKDLLMDPPCILKILSTYNINFIVLAGYLRLVSVDLINAYKGKIINIHPALLPKYGGKGMFGRHVHEAVHNAHESETGITIHHVNEHYDMGDIIFQAKVALQEHDKVEDIAAKIHQLEMKNYPKVIEDCIINSLH